MNPTTGLDLKQTAYFAMAKRVARVIVCDDHYLKFKLQGEKWLNDFKHLKKKIKKILIGKKWQTAILLPCETFFRIKTVIGTFRQQRKMSVSLNKTCRL